MSNAVAGTITGNEPKNLFRRAFEFFSLWRHKSRLGESGGGDVLGTFIDERRADSGVIWPSPRPESPKERNIWFVPSNCTQRYWYKILFFFVIHYMHAKNQQFFVHCNSLHCGFVTLTVMRLWCFTATHPRRSSGKIWVLEQSWACSLRTKKS